MHRVFWQRSQIRFWSTGKMPHYRLAYAENYNLNQISQYVTKKFRR